MKKLLLAAILLIPLTGYSGEITKVSVLDSEFREIKVLSTKTEISRFAELWSKRSKQEPIKVWWPYKLDISEKSKSERWFYHPDGWVQLLSAKTPKVYKLSSPEEFHELLVPSQK